MALHNKIGEMGEAVASTHLKLKGYKELDKNWSFDRAEIDIISQHQGFIIFTEVKTRASADYGEPEVFVNRKKQRQIIKAANAYILEKEIDMEARFDVVSVLMTFTGKTKKVKHIENAFYPIA